MVTVFRISLLFKQYILGGSEGSTYCILNPSDSLSNRDFEQPSAVTRVKPVVGDGGFQKKRRSCLGATPDPWTECIMAMAPAPLRGVVDAGPHMSVKVVTK